MKSPNKVLTIKDGNAIQNYFMKIDGTTYWVINPLM